MSMTRPVIWILLPGTLVVMVTPVCAQCNPSHAVVAVVSIISTLAFVTAVLLGIYFLMKWRRKAETLPQTWKKTKKSRDVYTNRGFTHNEDFVPFEEGVTQPSRRGQRDQGEQALSRKNKDNSILHSTPKSGNLHRRGSHRSLDETLNYVDTETISVTLESQDIIGLGFNICGSYGDGIRVSEVHNRGPAKESGLIKVGDKILSVTVSYQNIVYEDALTILSYASPYPVKIVLEKITNENLKHFGDIKEKGSLTQRIKHPLYHSRSLDTIKSVSRAATSAHPKRAVSDLKLESVKHLLTWHSSNSKNGHTVSNKEGPALSKNVKPRNGNPTQKEKDFIIWERDVLFDNTSEEVESAQEIRLKNLASLHNKNPEHLKAAPVTYGTVAEVTSKSYGNSDQEYIYQNTPQNKPEQENRSSSAIQNSSTVIPWKNDQTTPSSATFAYAISSVTDDEIDVDEIIIEPDISTIDTFNADSDDDEQVEETSGNMRNLFCASEHISGNDYDKYMQRRLSSPVNADSLEETTGKSSNKCETLLPVQSDAFFSSKQDLFTNISTTDGELQNSPTLDEGICNRILAMNAYTADTQNWADVPAEEVQVDDFVLNHPILNGEAVPDSHKPSERELQSILYYPHVINHDESRLTNLQTSLRFVDSQDISHNSDSSTGSTESTNHESAFGDTLEWSGTRLVRSKSFSNIFVSE